MDDKYDEAEVVEADLADTDMDPDHDHDHDDHYDEEPRQWRVIIIVAVVAVVLVALIGYGLYGRDGGENGNGAVDENGDGNGDGGPTTNKPPRAIMRIVGGSYQDFVIEEPIVFDAGFSSDPEEGPLTYSWDFDASDGIQEDAIGVRVNHTYTARGNYTITLTVDDGNTTSTDNETIRVSDMIKIEFDSTGEQRPRQGKQFQLTVTDISRPEYLQLFSFEIRDPDNGSVEANGTLDENVNNPTAAIYTITLDQQLSVNDTIVIKDESGADEGYIFVLYHIDEEAGGAKERLGEWALTLTSPIKAL